MANITEREIGIPSVLKVEPGAAARIGQYLKACGIENVVIFFGNGLIDMFGTGVMESLETAGIEVLSYQELDDVNVEDLVSMAFDIPNKAQAIMGMGGGKVIDGAKYMGFLKGIPFISFPTSSSSDGFASASASLLVGGRRKSVPAKLAYGVIVDTDIIKTAPMRFIYSGIGDMVAKITAVYDWQYEAQCGSSEFNDFAVMVAKKAVNSFVRTPFSSITDSVYLRELMDSLAMSGVANVIAGSSAPTSGSEHLISHALDSFLEHPQLHGVQVGIATYLMARVQDHRYERIDKVFTKTGFWDYVETLNLNVKDYLKAIDLAPSMKPFRHTYLHEEKYRRLAKQILLTDEKLKKVFHLTGKEAFCGFVPGRDAFDGSSVDKDTFDGASVGKDAFDGSSAGKDAFTGSSAGRDAFTGSSPGRDAFTGSSAGRDAFTGSSAGRDAFDGFDGIIFDVDGTLWDSTDIAAAAYNKIFEQEGIDKHVTGDDLKLLFGKPMDVIFQTILPDLEPERAAVLADACMELENADLEKNFATYYPEIRETFAALSAKIPLFIVSNCQKGYIEIVLEGAGLKPYVRDFLCFGDTGTSKGQTILTLMHKNDLENPVYVGDIQGDADACYEAGISIIHAAYGFGTIRKPAASIKELKELRTLFNV